MAGDIRLGVIVPSVNTVVEESSSKTAISAGTCRPKSPSITRGTEGSNPLPPGRSLLRTGSI
jgi:hypothetical protein